MIPPVEPGPAAGTVLAHLSDPHLPLTGGLHPSLRSGKRLLSLLSWRLRRYRRHRAETLAALVADLQDHAPDWIAVTGDLTNLGLPAEYRRARAWLDTLGRAERVMVIPGNHDALVPGAWAAEAARWRPYWQGDDAAAAGDAAGAFPVLRRRGPLALIGMSSAIASPVGFATGAVGAAQLARLGPILRDTRAAGLCRVLMIHHPPLEGMVTRRKQLVDGAALREVLAREGVELVLHGHSHRSHFETLQTSGGAAPVIGVPSASSMHHEPAAYHLYRVTPAAAGWTVVVGVRCMGPDGAVGTGRDISLPVARAHAP